MKFSKKLYDKLAAKVNNIDTSGFVLKTKYDTDKSELEKKKILDTSGIVKKKIDTSGIVKKKIIMLKLLR